MIPFIHDALDPYSRYGLDHFRHKYGMPLPWNAQEGSKISVQYGTKAGSDFSLWIDDNPTGDDIAGCVRTMGKEIPVFETPKNTGEKGKVAGWFTGEREEYPCITETEEGIHIGLDIFRETGHLLSGHLERVWKGPDEALKRSIVELPIVDQLEGLLFRWILIGCQRMKIPLVTQPLWPDDRPYAVCLTHDVDEVRKTYQWLTHPLKLLRRLDGRGLYLQVLSFVDKISGKEPYWTFDTVMKMEEEFGVRSSFFFLQETAKVRISDMGTWRHSGRRYAWDKPPVDALIRDLGASGWDIGLHGSFQSYLDASLLDRERKALERVTKNRVCTIRQHNLNLRIPDTWLHQERSGLVCDTTLGFNEMIGFRWGTCFPFWPFHQDEGRSLKIVEVPLIIEDIALFNLPDPQGGWMKPLNAVRECGGVLTLLWHHPVFNDHEYPGWSRPYRDILATCKNDGAWITSARAIAEWWMGRNNARLHCSFTDDQLTVRASPDERHQSFRVHIPQGRKVRSISHGTLISTGSETYTGLTEPGPEHHPVLITFSEVNHGD
ncbi:MAG: polysaccharide deacetylase family protein [Methanomicrobiales archaeon]|nr:polysaccharide deacetylase family protein [Methanomicrobiales archaeon]